MGAGDLPPLIEFFGLRPGRFDLLRRGVEIAGITKQSFVVEVGCAYGAGSFFLAEEMGCQMLGVDRNDAYMADAKQSARARGLKNIEFVIGYAEKLPLKNGCEVDEDLRFLMSYIPCFAGV